MPLVLGVDSSTSACKVELRDAGSGELVAAGRAPHPPTTPPRSEQDPAAWRDRYRALVAAHHDAVLRRLAAAGADYLALDTREPLDRALHAWLRARPRRLAPR